MAADCTVVGQLGPDRGAAGALSPGAGSSRGRAVDSGVRAPDAAPTRQRFAFRSGPGPVGESLRHRRSDRETQGSVACERTSADTAASGSLEDAELAKEDLERLVKEPKQPETTRLWRTICHWWNRSLIYVMNEFSNATASSHPNKSTDSISNSNDHGYRDLSDERNQLRT